MLRKQRAYELKIGIPVVLNPNFFSPSQEVQQRVVRLEDYYDNSGGKSYLIENHDISFRVTKTSDADKNTCEVSVKNLAPTTVSYVMDNRGKDLYIELNVGYKGEIKTLFKGTLKSATTSLSSTDTTLRLDVVDGLINNDAYTSRTYPKGTPLNKILKDLQYDLALPSGRIVPLDDALKTSAPMSIFGNTCDKMEALAQQTDQNFTISEGLCYITPRQASLSETVSYLSHDTGLLGSVTKKTDRADKVKKTYLPQDSNEKIRFTCQMDASIQPPMSVYVHDPDAGFDGVYKVEAIQAKCSGIEKGGYQMLVDCIKNDNLVLEG